MGLTKVMCRLTCLPARSMLANQTRPRRPRAPRLEQGRTMQAEWTLVQPTMQAGWTQVERTTWVGRAMQVERPVLLMRARMQVPRLQTRMAAMAA